MFSKLGALDITCDAPSYAVVQACEGLGFITPLDVRWCQMDHFLSRPSEEAGAFHPWKWFFGKGRPKEKTCSCGAPLPHLEMYSFTFSCEKVVDYNLGQCRRCRTIFWQRD
jgi:hypothetical protein